MIKPAATSAASSLALAVGAQAGAGAVAGDEAAASGDFAALLQSTSPATQDSAASIGLATDPAAAALLRQAAGKDPGKVLPLELPVAAAVNATAAAEAAPATEIILPGLVIPISPLGRRTPPAETPVPAEQPTPDSLAQTVAATQAIRAIVPAATTATALAAKPEKARTTKADETTSTSDTTEDATAPAIAVPVLPIAAPDQTPVVAALPVPTQPTKQPTVEASAPTTMSRAAALPLPLPQAAQAQMPVATAPHTPQAQPAVETVAAGQPAKTPTTAAFTMNVATPRAVAIAAVAPTAAIQAATPATAKTETTEITATPGTVDGPQPIVATDPQTFAQTVNPIETAPGLNRAGVQSGHDFATLVDRLVEARQAAMPEAVHAAVRHSEFGQVSLRFDQDASGLSVSMTSPDPGFAKAVQASAASAQTQTSSDNGSNAPKQDGRQDGQQMQPQTGSTFGQSQTHSQSGTRDDRARQTQTETRSGRTADRQRQDDDAAETRGGIYA